MMKHIVYFFFLILFNNIQIIISNKSEPNYYRYLQQFGYTPKVESRLSPVFTEELLSSGLSRSVDSDSTDSFHRQAIKTFQRLYKLPITGELDEKTKELMQRPRCGNPDLGIAESTKQRVSYAERQFRFSVQKRSVTQTTRWQKNHLKWFIEGYPQQQKYITSHDDIRRIMNEAFHDWEKYSGLKFEMVNTKDAADLKLNFYSHYHGDDFPFEGPGVTLAHAFYPTDGSIHFDDDETFTDSYAYKEDEYTLRLLAAHEIGHALGLNHSFEEDSIMFAAYQHFDSNYNISNNDQLRIQALYGKPNIEPVNMSAGSFNTLPIANWCPADFQTGCEGPDGKLYLFKDNQVWRYRARGKPSWDYQPALINERFPSITETKISACVKSTSGYTYFFRDNRMWKLKTHWSIDGPHEIQGKHYPENPSVALFHQKSIYFLHNRLVYRFNEFDYDKELEISTMNTILNPPPNDSIQSGFTYAKRHYIFTSDQVYVYDSNDGNLLSGYPKPLNNGWFACQTASQPEKSKKKTTKAYRKKWRT